MAVWAQDHKNLPADVTEPLVTLLGYALWTAEFVCVCWLIVGAGRYVALKHSTVETHADAHNAVIRSLCAAALATVAMPIAIAVLQTV